LPHLTRSLPIIVVTKIGFNNTNRSFKVNRRRVYEVLKYLCKNNRHYIARGKPEQLKFSKPLIKNLYTYSGITISDINVQTLPEDGIPDDIITFEDVTDDDGLNIDNGPEIIDDPKEVERIYEAFVENEADLTTSEKEKIKRKVNLQWPTTKPGAINEFQIDALCSLVFPKLFPNGAADPTSKSRLFEVSETDGFKHLMKVAVKNSKNQYYYPFASHPRFKFWSNDRVRR
jgi:hypothetical protein